MITIPPEVYSSLRKSQIDILVTVARLGEARKQEILEALPKKTSGTRLADTLDILVFRGLVQRIEKNMVVLYKAVGIAEVQNAPCNVQNALLHPTTLTLTKHEPTNKQDLGISENPQAKTSPNRVTTPEGAGQVAVSSSAAPAPDFPPDSPPKPKTLFPIRKNEHVVGTMFFSDNPTDFLYVAIQDMEGKTAADPDHKPTSIADPAPIIPMYEAFWKTIHNLWHLCQKYHNGGKTVNDFVLHRAGYMFVSGSLERTNGVECYHNPETFVSRAKKESGQRPLYKKMVGWLQDHYVNAGFGWDCTVLSNRDTYKAEADYVLSHKLECRRDELFVSHLNDRGLLAGFFRRWALLSGGEQLCLEPPSGESGGSVSPVMKKIAELLGEKRFDLWFGQETVFHDDGGTPVFTVADSIRIDLIRRHCKAKIDQALTELYGETVQYDFKVRAPPGKVPEREEVVLMKMK